MFRLTDTHGDTLHIQPTQASSHDGTTPVVSFSLDVPDGLGIAIYVPLERVEELIAGIRDCARQAAAGQPSHPTEPASEDTPATTCGKCQQPLDPTDTRHDGHARYRETPYCRRCIDRCHESTDAFHVCAVCR